MIQYVSMQGWKRFKEYTLIKVGELLYLSGPNGSGKSSVIQAIQWGLTGEIPGLGKDSRSIANLMSKDIAIIVIGTYKGTVTRILERHGQSIKSKLVFETDEGKEFKGKQAQAAIDMYVNPLAWAFNQRALQDMTPAERRKVLLELIGIKDESARDVEIRLEMEKRKLLDLRSRLRTINKMIEEAGVDLPRADIVEIELKSLIKEKEELQEKLKAISGDIKELRKRKSQLELRKERCEVSIQTYKQSLENAEKKIAELEPVANKNLPPEPVVPEIEPDVIAEEIKAIERGLGKLEERGKMLRKMIDGELACPIDGEVCPRDWVDTSNVEEELSQLRSRFTELQDKRDKLASELEEYKIMAEAHSQWEKKTKDILSARTTIIDLDKQRELAEQSMTATQEELREIEQELAKIVIPEEDTNEMQAMEMTLQQVENRIEAAKEQLRKAKEIEKYAEDKNKIEAEIEEAKGQIAKLEREQSNSITNKIMDVLQEATRILNKMGLQGTMTFKVEKKDFLLGLYDASVGVEKDLRVLSQGESVLYWIALAAALLSRHKGLKVLTIEGAELDEKNLSTALRGLQNQDVFDSVVVATWVDIDMEDINKRRLV